MRQRTAEDVHVLEDCQARDRSVPSFSEPGFSVPGFKARMERLRDAAGT